MAQIATTPDAIAAPVANRPVGTQGGAAIRHILQNKVGTVGFVIFFGFVLLAILGPLLVPAETVHSVRNVGTGHAAELATYVVEKGKPFLVIVD